MARTFKQKRKQAQTINKQLKNVGIIAELVVDIGVVGQFLTADLKPKGFVPFDDDEDIARGQAQKLANELTGDDNQRLMTCLYVGWTSDTALTGSFKPKFYSLENPDQRRVQSLKRQGDFIADHLPEEIVPGKKFWGHIQWVRLPEGKYGGDLSLTDDDAINEMTLLISHIPNKKEALALLNDLQEGTITVDDLAAKAGVSRGFDEAWKKQQAKTGETKAQLSSISAVTAAHHDTLEGFLSTETVNFITAAYNKNSNDVEKTAAECGASPGDLAIVMSNKDYFTDLMTKVGKGEQESVAVVAKDLDVPVTDICALLDIDPPAF